jgi:hypothetical protein
MLKRIPLVVFATTLVAIVLPAPLAQQQRPNVLLVTLDTVRADRIGAYGYKLAETPNLDRLARDGVRFDDATTQAPLTAPAHVALLTGIYPTRLGVKDNASSPLPDSAETLAETLKAPEPSSGRSSSTGRTVLRRDSIISTRRSRASGPS